MAVLLTIVMVVLLTKAASVYTVAVRFCYHGCHVYWRSIDFLVVIVTVVTRVTTAPVGTLLLWLTKVTSVHCVLWLREHDRSVSLCVRVWALSCSSKKRRLSVWCLSVCMEQLSSDWTDFHKILYWGRLLKSLEQIHTQVWWKPVKHMGHFTWGPKYAIKRFVLLTATCVEITVAFPWQHF